MLAHWQDVSFHTDSRATRQVRLDIKGIGREQRNESR